MAKKRIKAFGEWVEDHLRRACGALSPDKRIIVILTLLLFFSVLSLYFTVSSIYRFGKGAGERMQIRHIERLELELRQRQEADSVKHLKDFNYDDERKQNKQPEAGKKELTPRQIQMRKKMVVFPLFFLAFAGCMWLIFSPGEKEREEPSAGFNTELPTPESEGILSDKRDAYVQEEMRRREREKMRSLQDFAFGMEDEEEEPVMPAAVPDKSSGPAGGSSGAFRTSRAAYADINRQLGSFTRTPPVKRGKSARCRPASRNWNAAWKNSRRRKRPRRSRWRCWRSPTRSPPAT